MAIYWLGPLVRVFRMHHWLLVALLSLTTLAADARPPAQVIVVGTYHFSNANSDIHNVEAVDVMTPQRQAQLQTISDALSRFEPTLVAVEWPSEHVDESYAKHLSGTLAPSTNEVVQLGFRLAQQRGLARVHGIDVDGDFPFQPVQAWAKANGRDAELAAMLAGAEAMVKRTEALQADGTIASALRYMNSPATIAQGQAFYAELVRFGSGDEQPGVALNAAWERRNMEICARLVQLLEPGDRAVVFYGQGHAHLLRRCIRETPGLELVEANDYLPGAVGLHAGKGEGGK